MSATKLLVLGAIIERGSAHGYQVRKDLESWSADLWGNLGQGSVYHALRRLQADALILAGDPGQGSSGPSRTEYSPTPAGREAFVTLLEQTLSADGRDMAETMAAIGFLPVLPRARAVELLHQRIGAYRERRARVVAEYERHREEEWAHHIEAIRFWAQSADEAIAWAEGLIARLEAGEYVMADDSR